MTQPVIVTHEDGTTYQIAPCLMSEGLRAFGIVSNLIGPAMVALGKDADLKEAFGYMLQAPDLGARLGDLIKCFAPTTTVSGGTLAPGQQPQLSAIAEQHFAARYDALLVWLEAACTLNLASFLGGFRALAERGRIKAAVESLSQSPNPAAKAP